MQILHGECANIRHCAICSISASRFVPYEFIGLECCWYICVIHTLDSKRIAERVKQILHIIQLKYPDGLDRGVSLCLQTCKTQADRDQIYEVVALTFQVFFLLAKLSHIICKLGDDENIISDTHMVVYQLLLSLLLFIYLILLYLVAMIHLLLQGTRHAAIKEAQTTLYLSLQHPDASVRLPALKKIQLR